MNAVSSAALSGGEVDLQRRDRDRSTLARMARAALAIAAAGGTTALVAPRGVAALVILALLAAALAGIGARRARTIPGAIAAGLIGAGHCVAAASEPVDIGGTAVVSIVLVVALDAALSPRARFLPALPPWASSTAVLGGLALLSGPAVLVLAEGIGGADDYLYLPALAAGIATVTTPVVLAARRIQRSGSG